MTPQELQAFIQQGENAAVEFKAMPVRPETVAREMVAFANGSGGMLLLGVADDGSCSGIEDAASTEEWVMNIARTLVTPAIAVTCEILELDDKRIGIVTIPKGKDKPYQTGDKYLIRVGSTNRMATQSELMRLFQMSGVFHYDSIPVSNASINDLNMAALDSYFASYGFEFSRETEEARRQLLINTDILTSAGEPTVGGLLMFGINPTRYLPQAAIMFAHFNGTEIDAELIDRKEITGTLPNQVDAAVAVMKNNLLQPSTIEGTKRKDTTFLPPDKVLREMVVNACVHRNYAITGSRIRIFMYDDRIECISPGRLPNTVTVEKLRSGVSYASNPVLLKFMDNLRYIDRLGRGFPMIFREMRQLGKAVDVYEFGEELRVVLPL
ncbi:RNA-binding domain-containing protein [Candidatus Thiothrix sp. Deng01]|uniref:RNA-binding domain-containing protein n=1 Tax=Candidatus Thiothrix phosphatis TaxID=3112415 RepID=A0ABU6CVX5_9GAMM|nr:RNA-binding domain-containing protein [Candidatus Thiothrix sp. Deng01]MEB4590939.1 RNA-binding domain-containing protein [Candidatus Thiothrix sp. Deng01]